MDSDQVLDVKGEKCPMPVIKTKQKVDELESGEVLEVLSTDSGAEPDIESLANRVAIEYLGTEEDDEGIYHVYVKKE